MNVNSIKNYDMLVNLPTDEIMPSENELKIVNMLFKNERQILESTSEKEKNMFKKYYTPLIVVLIFFILSLPTVDNVIGLVVRTDNFFIPLIIKCIIMFFILICM